MEPRYASKTYPFDEISKRTEEFYFQNGQLVLAVIEDDGQGDKGKSTAEIDNMYYFHDGEVIHEINNTGEEEVAIWQSDGERLLEEAKEYVAIFSNK